MTHSESISNIAKALSLFHIKVDTIKKDANNPFFKSTYASLSNILDSIKEPLMESGLSIAQFPHKERTLITLLMHGESGEWIESFYEMTPVKDDPQGRGSVLTYQRRYALSAILLLNIDDDDDGNASSYVGQKSEPVPEEDKRPWLNDNTDAFIRAKDKIRSGEITLDVVRKHYKISKKIESLLTGKQS
jgi:hypothetical protein